MIASEDTYAVAGVLSSVSERDGCSSSSSRPRRPFSRRRRGRSIGRFQAGVYQHSPTTSSGSASTRTIGPIRGTSITWFRFFDIAGRRTIGSPSAIPASNCGCCCISRTQNPRRVASAVKSDAGFHNRRRIRQDGVRPVTDQCGNGADAIARAKSLDTDRSVIPDTPLTSVYRILEALQARDAIDLE